MIPHRPHTKRGPQFPLRLITTISLVVLSIANLFIKERAQEPEDVIRVRTDLVAVPVAITDAQGRRILGLKTDDFVLSDDGSNARIDYFASGVERVALAFLLDNSGSLREQLARQRDAALALFARFGPASTVTVIRFGQQAKVITPFTGESEKARVAFDAPGPLSERTAIFDAASTTVELFRSRGENSAERHIGILISDGLDTASKATSSQVIEAANRANVSFFVIQLPLFTPREGRLVPRPAAKGFRDLAEKTGGRYFVAGNAHTALNPDAAIDLAPVFAAIEEGLRSQYVLGFYPRETSRDGQMHRVTIGLANRNSRLRVHQVKTTYRLNK
ncbi:MAG TPA: VWA domain-containing protein [Pyrinomonadaceae bacterium]|nr:VWA domain-containing protein [Pyrinomonadaceae bacterium]